MRSPGRIAALAVLLVLLAGILCAGAFAQTYDEDPASAAEPASAADTDGLEELPDADTPTGVFEDDVEAVADAVFLTDALVGVRVTVTVVVLAGLGLLTWALFFRKPNR